MGDGPQDSMRSFWLCEFFVLEVVRGLLERVRRAELFAQTGWWRDTDRGWNAQHHQRFAYKANAYAFALASSTVVPYAIAPGTSGISAIQRAHQSRARFRIGIATLGPPHCNLALGRLH